MQEISPSSREEILARHDAPKHDTARHTLTVQQAADLFAQLGAPRSSRSVQRFCEQRLLDAISVTGENGTARYFIDPESVERYAAELKQLQEISQLRNDVSRHDAPQHDTARHDATKVETPTQPSPTAIPDRETEVLRERVGTLEKENFQLRIDRESRVQMIEMMAGERHGFIEQLTTQSREIGRLETQLQLAAPRNDVTRHDATAAEVIVLPAEGEGRGEGPTSEPTPEAAPVVTAKPEPPMSKSWWSW
jgi:hypothetical protein